MNIQQLRESQRRQIEALGKFTPVVVYMPLSAEDAADVVQHGSNVVQDGKRRIITPSYKYAAAMGDVVISTQVKGEHIEVPEEYSTKENVKKAYEMYPESLDPLVTMALLSDKPEAYFTGAALPNQLEKLFITGYDADGNKVPTGSEKISYPPTRYLDWYVRNIVVPRKRNRLQK